MRWNSHSMVLMSLAAVLALVGCGESAPGPGAGQPEAGGLASITIDYPLEGSVFPPDFTSPTFLWHDDNRSTWTISVSFADGDPDFVTESGGPPPPRGEIDPEAIGPTNSIYEGTPYQRSARSWTPDAEQWAGIQRRSVDSPVTLTIHGRDDKGPAESVGTVTFSTSSDPVDGPIFYRDVPLMPSKGENGKIAPLDKAATPLIAWRLRDVSLPDSKVLLTDMPSCANCHSFSADGNTLGMDVDGPQGDKGAYALAPIEQTTVIGPDEVITWNSFKDKPEDHRTFGFLSRVSPDGTYAITTLNEALYVSNFTNHEFLQVFYPTRGILAWYSRETGEMEALPGADDTDYVHCNPVWFPDGKELVIARAGAFDPYEPGQPLATFAGDPNEPKILFDLYRMPFNEGKGGPPVPIPGASNNGMSNTFPKISPDGKWLVWTKCGNGQLMRPDGKLWIVSTDGGEPREMNCNTSLMNSWHSFSPNSRWLVWSSKVNTPYTQMFLTHIDEDGNDTPAILIPNSTAANRAVNIPEFVNRAYAKFDAIDVPVVDHHRFYQEGEQYIALGQYEEAAESLRKAIEKDPEFTRAMVALGFVLLDSGKVDESRVWLGKAIEQDPRSSVAHMNLGLGYFREGNIEKAHGFFLKAVEYQVTNQLAHLNLGLSWIEKGDLDKALESCSEAVHLAPDSAECLNALGFVKQKTGDLSGAIADYRAALDVDSEHALARANLGVALAEAGNDNEALPNLRVAVGLNPGSLELRRCIAGVLLRNQLAGEAVAHLDVLVRSGPFDLDTRMNLAWLLATLPSDEIRDGIRAVQIAEECLNVVGNRPEILDILAAAYAEAGRMPDAVKTARRAVELAKRGGSSKVAPGLEARLKSYEAGRPFRQ